MFAFQLDGRYHFFRDFHRHDDPFINGSHLKFSFSPSPFFLFFSFQSRSSIFRGVILCLCLNLTYANVARFPRELQQHGSAFLVPYGILLLLVGLPVVLLEISLGQFLGQGSAHMWRAAPFLKGKFRHFDNFLFDRFFTG